MRTGKPPGTKLQRDLAGGTDRRRPTPLDAFRLARRKFLSAERIDMSALAEELGVNLFYAGHYATETFGVQALAAHLAKKFRVPWEFIDHPTGL